jgi:hypothetical protein
MNQIAKYQSTLTFFGVFFKGYFGNCTWKNLRFIWHIKFFAHIDCASWFSLEWEKNVGKVLRGGIFWKLQFNLSSKPNYAHGWF